MTNDQKIRNLCEASGLAVSKLRLADDILVVTPTSLDALPDAEALAALSDQLREVTSARYVTVDIEDQTEDHTTGER
jgi:hypothetical protein